jgi:hypothetical protein
VKKALPLTETVGSFPLVWRETTFAKAGEITAPRTARIANDFMIVMQEKEAIKRTTQERK